MSERDELVAILERDDLYYDTGSHYELATEDAADAILAAGYRKLVVDESTIERAAKALHELGCAVHPWPWERRDEDAQELYREDVRAVIAALQQGEG